MSLIYVPESEVPLTSTRKDLVRRFIRGKSYRTYNDSQCTQLQCEKGKFRSVTEIHLMVMSRFPKTSLEAIVRIINELIEEDACITMVWCTQVNKVVLKYYDRATKEYMSSFSRKNYYTSKGVDGYSLKDFEEIKNNLN